MIVALAILAAMLIVAPLVLAVWLVGLVVRDALRLRR